MGRVALRGIRAHLVRFILSVLAVALGVAFVAGTFSLRSMLDSTFSGIVSSSMTGDAYVRGSHLEAGTDDISGESGTVRNRVPIALAEKVATVDGVKSAFADLSGSIVLVGKDGTAVINAGAPSFGMGLYPEDPTATVKTGRLPSGPNEVALEESTLKGSGLAVGDPTTVVVGGELRKVTVVGEISGIGALAGATITFFDVPTAQAAFAPDGLVQTISVYGADGVSESTLASAVGSVLPSTAVAATGDEMRSETQASIDKALGFIQTFLLIFALISLFVGAFIISNTFTMLVRQRMRELALLRAIGASPTQVFASVLVQAAVVGLVGAGFGIAGGLGLVTLLRVVFEKMGMDLSGRIPLDTQTVVISLVIGVVVSVLAAALPARRAAMTKPVEAMRDDVAMTEHSLRLRAVIGGALTTLGAAAILVSMAGADQAWVADNRGGLLGAGAGGVVIGVLMLAPVVARASLGVLAAPFVAWIRPIGRLARGNVTRNPRRTATTASALVIGMALVGAASVLAASTQASMRSIVDEQFTTDFLVTSATYVVPTTAVDKIESIDSVAGVDSLWVGGVSVSSGGSTPKSAVIAGTDPAAFGRSIQISPDSGSLATLASGEVAAQKSAAKTAGWKLGDEVTITSEDRTVTAKIGAIIDTAAINTPLVVPLSVFDAVVAPAQATVDTVLITAKPGTSLEALRSELTTVVKPYVVLTVLDSDEFASSLAAQVNQILTILYALLGLSIVIAVLGIINTLALSVIERTREIGLLRAVGLGRVQLAGTVTIESILTAIFGTVLGLGVGVAIASAMPTVFADQGFTTLVVPWASLGWMLVLAAIVGVFAAVWPAIRAARLAVLDAVSYE